MRLDKYLATVGLGTRSEVKKLLRKKSVSVDGAVITDGKFQLDPAISQVMVGQKVLTYQNYYYYMLNKPKGVVSATTDRVEKTVLGLLVEPASNQKLFPVGRLDKDTTGLLLLTNDGALSHELLSPKKHVAKTYVAQIAGIVTPATCVTFASSMTLKNGEKTKPAKLKILTVDEAHERSKVEITITEGKYHQVKRMFAAAGMKVLELERLQMGSLKLDPTLKRGDYRPLSEQELAKLRHESL